MKFDELDARMRALEEPLDLRLPPRGWVVARLDGRGFSRLTREKIRFEKPFDERFRDLILESARVVATEFNAVFGHTHSDEMSLLLAPVAPDAAGWPFEGRARKYLSLMAASASVAFSLGLKSPVAFDCRLVVLESEEDVVDYFRWRASDSERNALSAHGYWHARAAGTSARLATKMLLSLSPAQKVERLRALGVDYAQVPLWQKRGAALMWKREQIHGVDPRDGAATRATRRRLRVEMALPEGEAYALLIRSILKDHQLKSA